MSEYVEPKYIDVLQNIEIGLKNQYEQHAKLKDTTCIYALDAGKIAVKQNYGFAKNEKVTREPLTEGIIDWCVLIGIEQIGKENGPTLKEYINLVEEVKRSVIRHSKFGPSAYYEFIKKYV
jgi:hypothetical protein